MRYKAGGFVVFSQSMPYSPIMELGHSSSSSIAGKECNNAYTPACMDGCLDSCISMDTPGGNSRISANACKWAGRGHKYPFHFTMAWSIIYIGVSAVLIPMSGWDNLRPAWESSIWYVMQTMSYQMIHYVSRKAILLRIITRHCPIPSESWNVLSTQWDEVCTTCQ